MAPDITVIIATYNRAEELARTLEAMAKTEKRGLSTEFVVVDNGSTDDTKSVVDSFSERIPIRYFFEARSGKNRALNTALENCNLSEIVVFTDDDVDVSPDWLISIRQVTNRWSNHSVFGGRINVVFPTEKIPKWATDPYVSSLGFGYHNYSNEECIYRNSVTPFGGNLWVRREIFDNGRRFDETVGPRPTNRIMGSETSFLFTLLKDGYEIVYAPTVSVGHRIQPEMIRLPTLFRRAYRHGRGEAHILGLPVQTQLTKVWPSLKQNPAAWHLYRIGSVILYAFKVLTSFIFSTKEQRPLKVVKKMHSLGYRVEAVRLLRERF